MRSSLALAIALPLWSLLGCEPDDAITDLQKDQREILYRLGRLEGLLQQAGNPSGAPANKPGNVEAPPVDPKKTFDVAIGNSAVKGPADAPVTILEFSDFQCGPCGEARTLVQQVLAAYPKDVKFSYKVLPLTTIHDNALGAAKAAVAAGKQGKFWEMHDVLFENQDALGPDKLPGYAAKIGLDVERWKRDAESAEVQQQIATETREARSNGIDSTPTFIVGGKQLGDRSFGGFKQLIDAALAAKR